VLSRRLFATFVVAVFSLSSAACSSLTRPDEITIKAEPPPAPPAPAAPAGGAAAPAPGAAPGGGG
jgi:hypothetical protein